MTLTDADIANIRHVDSEQPARWQSSATAGDVVRLCDALTSARRALAEAERERDEALDDYKRLLNESIEATHDLAVERDEARAQGAAAERAAVVAYLMRINLVTWAAAALEIEAGQHTAREGGEDGGERG